MPTLTLSIVALDDVAKLEDEVEAQRVWLRSGQPGDPPTKARWEPDAAVSRPDGCLVLDLSKIHPSVTHLVVFATKVP